MDVPLLLKAGSVSLTTLQMQSNDLDVLEATLAQKHSEAPSLLRNLPCALDLAGFTPEDLNLPALLSLCRRYGLLPIAVRNADLIWQPGLEALKLADLGANRTKTRTTTANPKRIKVHQGNVRSGQQLFQDGDLIIFGTVSAGAEVLATGDVHIYGTLRGRVLAGVKGDENAVISCQQFDAELVAIAGQYRVLEEKPVSSHPCVVRLMDGNLNIQSIS